MDIAFITEIVMKHEEINRKSVISYDLFLHVS
jgi:hypothetical protein